MGSAITVIGTVIIGLMATVFYAEIHGSWPVTAWNGVSSGYAPWDDGYESMHRNALTFWLAFLCFVLILFIREFHRLRADSLAKRELNTRIEHLRQMVSVMPPKNFLARASKLYERMSYEVDPLLYGIQGVQQEDASLDDQREAIHEASRRLLDTILNLVLLFQPPDSRDQLYTATVYWVVNSEKGQADPEFYWKGAKELAHTKQPKPFFSAVQGLMVQDLNLTTTSNEVGNRVEGVGLHPLCYGYFDDSGEGGKHNHPGVPMAVQYEAMILVEDAVQDSQKLPYPPDAIDKIKQFYVEHPELRCSMAIPLRGPNFAPDVAHHDTSQISAVLSISCNEPGMIANEDKALMFLHELTPFLQLLYRLCWQRMLMDIESGAPLRQHVAFSKDSPRKRGAHGTSR
ncbi:hypothetical protein R3F64_09465 [Halomonas sp. 5021]|uniref:hypothetical protein n=1 Tax=Halomonas sp. 5021 TaxID=3082156 RepID=UPI002FC98879